MLYEISNIRGGKKKRKLSFATHFLILHTFAQKMMDAGPRKVFVEVAHAS